MQTTNNTNYVESVSREVAAVAIEHFGANGSALPTIRRSTGPASSRRAG